MESTENTDKAAAKQQEPEEDGFEVTEINDVKDKLENVHLTDKE